MDQRWSAEQVVALAPDASSAKAGHKLSSPAPWSGTGASARPAAVWGLCQGSGKTPYATVVDLAAPAYKCSCPSRKFPCKHALGLLLLWSAGHVPDVAEPAEHAAAWLAARADRAERATAAPAQAPSDPQAAARRAATRARRVAEGVADLERWLHDQVEHGVAGADRAGYGPYEQVAARLVDAQAPGLAEAVRRLPAVAASGEGWPARLLDELALLHLLVRAHGRLDALDPGLAAVVRRRVGEATRTQDVLAAPPERDRWQVLATRDGADGRVRFRRVHVRGERTGRDLTVVAFAASGQPLEVPLLVGTTVDADLHVHPGDPTRAVVGARHGEPETLGPVTGVPLDTAERAWSQALTADPWCTAAPVVVDGLVPVPGPGGGEDGWSVVGVDAGSLPLVPSPRLWRLLAVSGGRPVTVVGDRGPAGLDALAAWDGTGLVAL